MLKNFTAYIKQIISMQFVRDNHARGSYKIKKKLNILKAQAAAQSCYAQYKKKILNHLKR